MILKKLIYILFPKRCPYCSKVIREDEYACESCIDNFPDDPIKTSVIGGFPCVSSFPYKDEYRLAFFKFKFRNKKQYGKSFAVSIANDIRKVYNNIEFNFITCIPLHDKQLKKRGYNQSEVLAKEIANILNIEYMPLLKKIKENRFQHDLNRKERAKNVIGVYCIDKSIDIKGKTVLLCDDVVTTGYTLGACCKILDKAGASMVYCASFLKR